MSNCTWFTFSGTFLCRFCGISRWCEDEVVASQWPGWLSGYFYIPNCWWQFFLDPLSTVICMFKPLRPPGLCPSTGKGVLNLNHVRSWCKFPFHKPEGYVWQVHFIPIESPQIKSLGNQLWHLCEKSVIRHFTLNRCIPYPPAPFLFHHSNRKKLEHHGNQYAWIPFVQCFSRPMHELDSPIVWSVRISMKPCVWWRHPRSAKKQHSRRNKQTRLGTTPVGVGVCRVHVFDNHSIYIYIVQIL